MVEKEITSLTKFIYEISEVKDVYYRGESKDYGDTKLMSNASRHLGDRPASEFIKLREDYYREIGATLSVKETENFISYSQHHGLPTELIDITKNPLIAMYFACSDSIEEDGFVYAINQKNTVNLDRRLINEDISEQKVDFLSSFIRFKNTMFHDEVKADQEFEKLLLDLSLNPSELIEYLNNYVPYIKDCIDDANMNRHTTEYFPIQVENLVDIPIDLFINSNWYKNIAALNQQLTEAFTKGGEIRDNLAKIFRSNETLDIFSEHFLNISYYNKISLDERFALLIIALAIDLKINPLGTTTSHSIHNYLPDKEVEFPPIKYLIHQPSVVFDRMQNQQALFIYQIWMKDQRERVVFHRLDPNDTFRIKSEDKKAILEQLDKIGINKKFIYPDHDNIAAYVNDKWQKHNLM